jgi:cytochrome c
MPRLIACTSDFLSIGLILLFAIGQSALASEQEDNEMNEVAKASGCYICHRVESRKPGAQEVLPFGPAWKDIANKHKGQADAVDRLTRIVMQGTGSNPAVGHWKGKAAGVVMLPNAVEINEADARKLVRWILSLDK